MPSVTCSITKNKIRSLYLYHKHHIKSSFFRAQNIIHKLWHPHLLRAEQNNADYYKNQKKYSNKFYHYFKITGKSKVSTGGKPEAFSSVKVIFIGVLFGRPIPPL